MPATLLVVVPLRWLIARRLLEEQQRLEHLAAAETVCAFAAGELAMTAVNSSRVRQRMQHVQKVEAQHQEVGPPDFGAAGGRRQSGLPGLTR